MIADVLPYGGIGSTGVVTVAAAQVVLRRRDGTPLVVAYETPDGGLTISRYDDRGFAAELRRLGEPPIEVQHVNPSPPGGASLYVP